MPIEFTIGSEGKPWWLEILIPVIPSIITALIVAWVSVKLAFQNHQKQNWWGWKADTYDDTISAVQNHYVILSEQVNATKNNITLDSTTEEENNSQINEANHVLRYAKGLAGFLLSSSVGSLITDYERTIEEAKAIYSGLELDEKKCELIKKLHQNLIDIAKTDLGVKSDW